MAKPWPFIAGSLLVTGGLLYYIFSQPVGLSWENLLLRFYPPYAVLYLMLYALGLWLRTWRYRRLIEKASGGKVVPWWPLTLVTAARNMLVDLFPARIGGWSYPLLLNRLVGVELSHCLTSFAYAFLFDLLSLAPFLGLILLWEGLRSDSFSLGGVLFASVLFTVVLLLFLFAASLTERWSLFLKKQFMGKKPSFRKQWKEKLLEEFEAFSHSLRTIKGSGDFWPLLGLSFLIRGIKYTLLYLMLRAVVEALLGRPLDLSFSLILFGLMGAETAASLPISGFAGIGFYEGFLGTILASQGIKAIDGVSLALAMHVLTQVVDYSLGVGALAFLFYRWGRRKRLLFHPGNGEARKTTSPDE